MTPFTKEQAEALAERIEALAETQTADTYSGVRERHALRKLATEIRNGTFIEVQP